MRNSCSNDGWLVDVRELSPDPADHDAPILPKLGCNNLRCAQCEQQVRSIPGATIKDIAGNVDTRALYDQLDKHERIIASPTYRVYVCHCLFHLEGGEQKLDDRDGPQAALQWKCVGHPIAELPHTFDGVSVTVDNLDQIVANAMADVLPANLRKSDQRAGVWLARLATRLDQTPHQDRVVATAAAHLTHPDEAIRFRAVQFFVNAPRFAKRMRPELLLGQHAELFVGVANPLGVVSTDKTLEYLVWRLAGPQLPENAPLRELAHTWALDAARASESLFIALALYDRQWFADNAAKLSHANPNRTGELLEAIDGEDYPAAVAKAIKSAAPA